MGQNVQQYRSKAPILEEVNVSDFPLQVARLDIIPNKTGWGRFKFSLPQSFRQIYQNDIVYGADWRELINDFDRKLLGPEFSGFVRFCHQKIKLKSFLKVTSERTYNDKNSVEFLKAPSQREIHIEISEATS